MLYLHNAPQASVKTESQSKEHRSIKCRAETATEKIVEAITRFMHFIGDADRFEETGRAMLEETVDKFVQAQEKIEFVFPAFPFKSPSRRKVLGSEPDLAEELLLKRLEKLALAVEEHHAPGAVIRIMSDGIVYGGTRA